MHSNRLINRIWDNYDELKKIIQFDGQQFKDFIKAFDYMSGDIDTSNAEEVRNTLSNALDKAHVGFNYDKLTNFVNKLNESKKAINMKPTAVHKLRKIIREEFEKIKEYSELHPDISDNYPDEVKKAFYASKGDFEKFAHDLHAYKYDIIKNK